MMTGTKEQWWERLGRMIGGWALALLVIWKYPVPPNGIEFMEAAVRWGFLAALIALGVGMAHSAVFGIVTDRITRIWAFWKRGGKERRNGGPTGGTHVMRRKGER